MAVAEPPGPPAPTPSPHCVELPEDVVDKIAELDLELSEGDITQKGYEKKRAKLLEPYLRKNGEIKSKTNGNSLSVDPSHSASGASCDSSRVSDSSGLSVSVSVDPNKPRSRRTHRRYYNEKRWGISIEQTKDLDSIKTTFSMQQLITDIAGITARYDRKLSSRPWQLCMTDLSRCFHYLQRGLV